MKYLKKWGVFEEQKSKYYNSVFYRKENTLRNTFRDENNSTQNEKYEYNSSIMKSKEFKDAIKYSDCYIHPLYKICYLSSNYKMVKMLDTIIKKLKKD